MDNLNTIPSQGNFGDIANTLNANFSTIRDAIGQVEYTTNRCRGMYASSTALGNAIASPRVGDWALVGPTASGNSYKADIYVCSTAGVWSDSGTDYTGDSLNLTNYVTQSTYTTNKTATDASISTLNSYFASGGVVAGHTASIDDLYDILQDRTEDIEDHTTAINDLQSDVSAHGTRLDQAESNIGQIHTQDTRQDEQIVDIYSNVSNVKADIRNIRAAISMISPGSGSGTGLTIVAMTQEAYDELSTKDADTLYIII